ncbi:hypothetical protein GCM10007301_56090 [Azorhizobium oxalatiphilum]|uniref:Uncharacterized protein n=1 Tax=Azorhizobium oxalatiphilum TaxID=980631 RepID=A0A917CK37_9HYPH|nr:hypothetical protein [Azorhizobium oxalatiphilum]GGF88963.1 hypothetical protein GCM10007301_56090 [Azorhizobium oxalatiphilum]
MLPPYLMVALGALGAAALTKFIATENRRVNDILDKQRPEDGTEPAPTPLERDPATGAYRPRAQASGTADETARPKD